MEDSEESSQFHDSQQHHESNRRLRAEYRVVLQDMRANEHAYTDPSSDLLRKTLTSVNSKFSGVRTTREAAMDSEILKTTAELTRRRVEKIDTNTISFNSREFVQKLQYYSHKEMDLENVDISWSSVGKAAFKLLRPAPRIGFMNGPMSVKIKKKVSNHESKRKKSKFDEKNADKLIETKEITADEKDQTTARIEEIFSILKREIDPGNTGDYEKCLDFFEFVVNPRDFGQTVENIFHLSFLVRDGKVEVFIDEEDDLPKITLCDAFDPETDDPLEKKQVIFELDYDHWRDIVQTFDIQGMIPHREN